MTYLITASNSFTGRHLVRSLVSTGDTVMGCGRGAREPGEPLFEYFRCDFTREAEVDALIADLRPERVIHLAASTDETSPGNLIATNIDGTRHFLEACHKHNAGKEGILVVGSAAGLGEMNPEEISLKETHTPRPGSFYGWSRESQLELGRIAGEKWGMPVFLCRPFNLIGPGLAESYVPTRLARQLIALKERGERSFALPNGNVVRDFVDGRDAVRAYLAILEKGRRGIPYHVASGKGVTLAELIGHLARALEIDLEIVPASGLDFANRSAILRSVADIGLIHRDTGWTPLISLTQSVDDLIEHLTNSTQPESLKVPNPTHP
jgi:GDP-4-dehydro-6-deoxy-D-mannose reductase